MTIYRIDRKNALKALNPETLWTTYNSSGKLNVTTAYSASVWAYRCIIMRAQTIAGIPVRVYDEATGKPIQRHPLNYIFGDRQSDLLMRTECALLIWGKNYYQITRAVLGDARGLRWLNPGAVFPVETPKGIETFTYTPQRGGYGRDFTPDEIVYMHTFDPNDDLGGISPLQVALLSVGVDKEISTFAKSFFGNGARIDGILTVPGANDEQIDNIEAKWKAVFRGVSNFFKTLIFGAADVKYTPISYAPEDLAMETLSAETRRGICAAFGVPPILAGAWEASNFATAREQRQSFYTETILPELDFLEDEINKQFVSRFYPGVCIAFDISEINALREDELTRNQALTTGVSGGWMTVNEARARVGLPAVPGGDVLLPAPGTSPIQSGQTTNGGPEVSAFEQFFRRESSADQQRENRITRVAERLERTIRQNR